MHHPFAVVMVNGVGSFKALGMYTCGMPGLVVPEALLQLLVCPVCRAPVVAGPNDAAHSWLRCTACHRYYPVQDGIPVMLEDRATAGPPL